MRIIVDYGRSLTSPRWVLSRHGNDFAWDRAARRENVSDLERDAEFRRGIARDVAMRRQTKRKAWAAHGTAPARAPLPWGLKSIYIIWKVSYGIREN